MKSIIFLSACFKFASHLYCLRQNIFDKYSLKNREYLIRPQLCGCFYCLTIFHSTELKEDDFLAEDDGQYTAWCPYCGIDSIIGEDCGYEITPELLAAMKGYWF